MKIRLKTATLIAVIVSALYSLAQIVRAIKYGDLIFYDFWSGIESIASLLFPVGLFIFFYSLYSNQK